MSKKEETIVDLKKVNPKKKQRPGKNARAQMKSKASTSSNSLVKVPKTRVSEKIKIFRAPNLGSSFSDAGSKIVCYVDTLSNPAEHMCRIPDASTNLTALVRTTQTFVVNANFTGGQGDGRFAFMVQPKLGNPFSLRQNAVSIVDPVQFANAAPDFSNPASFLSFIGNKDIRIDPQVTQLCQQALAFVSVQGIQTLVDSSPFGPGPLASNLFGGVNPDYGLDINSSYTGSAAAATSSTWRLPPGQWYLSISTGPTGFAAPPTLTATGNATVAVGPFDPLFVSYLVSVPGDAQGGSSSVLTFTATTGAAGSTFDMDIAPVATESVPFVFNAGIVQQIRPVALSVLASPIMSHLNDGGRISSCLVPPATIATNWFSANPSSSIGGLEYVDNLQNINGNYSGPIGEGSYAWWQPRDPGDLFFRTPDDSNAYDFPSIVMAGVFQPNTAPVGLSAPFLNVTVTRIYEITCNTTIFDMQRDVGSQMILDQVNAHLALQPHCMANAAHRPWFERIRAALQKAYGFYNQNKSWIVPGATALASLVV